MSRRDNTAQRCPGCHMHRALCVCALVPRLETRTRLALVIHRYEDRKPTNTGRIATACLPNSEVLVRGHEGQDAAVVFAEGSEPLLLFPHEDAEPLDRFVASTRPVTLVVPDGTWRQASKMRRRVPGLSNVRCVALPASPDRPTLRLRAEAHAHGLSTLEAIARALGVLEGPAVQTALEHLYLTIVERTLWMRGALATSDVTTGLPEAARRESPRGGMPLPAPPTAPAV